MFRRILKWLLKRVDLDIKIENQELYLTIYYQGMIVLTQKFDLMKETAGTIAATPHRGIT